MNKQFKCSIIQAKLFTKSFWTYHIIPHASTYCRNVPVIQAVMLNTAVWCFHQGIQQAMMIVYNWTVWFIMIRLHDAWFLFASVHALFFFCHQHNDGLACSPATIVIVTIDNTSLLYQHYVGSKRRTAPLHTCFCSTKSPLP